MQFSGECKKEKISDLTMLGKLKVQGNQHVNSQFCFNVT